MAGSMNYSVSSLTDRQFNLLRKGIVLCREELEKLFSCEFVEKHEHLEHATLVLEGDEISGYFFTLTEGATPVLEGDEISGFFFTFTEGLKDVLCCPDYDPIDTEFMLQDLFKCGIIKDEILVYMVDMYKPRKHRPDYGFDSWAKESAIMQDNVVTSKEFERMWNSNEISLDRCFIHIAKEGEK